MTCWQGFFQTGLASLVMAASVLPAEAVTRMRSDQNSCATVQATIERDGAVILRYPSARNPSVLLYDRYVSNRSQCDFDQELDRKSVPASDTASCRVQRCVEDDSKFNTRN